MLKKTQTIQKYQPAIDPEITAAQLAEFVVSNNTSI